MFEGMIKWWNEIIFFFQETINIFINFYQNNSEPLFRLVFILILLSFTPYLLLILEKIFMVISNLFQFIFYVLEWFFYHLFKRFGYSKKKKVVFYHKGFKYSFYLNRKTNELHLKSIKKIMDENEIIVNPDESQF